MRNRIVALALLLVFLCVFSVSAGVFWQNSTQRIKRSAGSTEAPAADGWVRLTAQQTAAISGVPQRYIKSVGGLPVEMDSGEKAAVNLIRTRATARSRLLSAVNELLASQEIKTRLNAAGKSETLIDARIAALDTAITTALGNHP